MNDNKRTIIITGGGSGIGMETAIKFAENGDNVIITGRTENLTGRCPLKYELSDDQLYIIGNAARHSICYLRKLRQYRQGKIDLKVEGETKGKEKKPPGAEVDLTATILGAGRDLKRNI